MSPNDPAERAFAVPANACDSHLHIYDPRFPEQASKGAPHNGFTVSDYRRVQQRLGTRRAVIVQAKRYGTDNACVLDALAQFKGQARGVGVVHPDIGDAALREMDAGGMRGLRFSVHRASDTVAGIDTIEPLAARLADLGWHVQLHISGDQIVNHAAMLARLPCTVVIDHLARLSPEQGIDHPAYGIVCGLLERGRCWMKLSAAYLNTRIGAPDYPDASAVARAFAKAAPERMVWGSDWPHGSEAEVDKPDAVNLLNLLGDWVPDAGLRARILVDNPAALYGFA